MNFALPWKRTLAPGDSAVQGDVRALKFYLRGNNAGELGFYTPFSQRKSAFISLFA